MAHGTQKIRRVCSMQNYYRQGCIGKYNVNSRAIKGYMSFVGEGCEIFYSNLF